MPLNNVDLAITELRAMLAAGEISAEEFRVAQQYVLGEIEAPNRPRRSKTTTANHTAEKPRSLFIDCLIALFIAATVVAGGVALSGQNSSGSGDTVTNLRNTETAQLHSIEPYSTQKEAAEVEWVPVSRGNGGTPIQSDFYRSRNDGIYNGPISTAGYPVIVARMDVPVCENAFLVKEAMDAWRGEDARWISSLSACIILKSGTEMEWVRNEFEYTDTIAIRLSESSGARITLYAPISNSEVGIDGWFGAVQR